MNAAVRKIITYQFWLFLEMVLLPQLDKKAYNKAQEENRFSRTNIKLDL